MSLVTGPQPPTIACDLHYWTANNRQCQISNDNISAFCYHEKVPKKQDGGLKSQNVHSQYHQAKQQYVESRGGVWTLTNKRPDRLSDAVKELEEILKSNTVLHVRWGNSNSIQLVINTGLIVNILVSEMNDIEKIFFDKSLAMKIAPEHGIITSACLANNFCLLCFDGRDKLGFVSFAQWQGTPDQKQMASKISSMDKKISFHDIPGAPAQRGCRKLCLNRVQDLAICWCPSHTTAVPSGGNVSKEEKANMVLLQCTFNRLEVCSYIYTESSPISVEFSKLNPYQVHSLERTVTSKNEVVLQYVTYESTRNRLQRLEVSLIPVKSGVLSCSRNSEETKLAVGCTDGTVLVYDMMNKSVLTVRDAMVPSVVSWHPNGGVVLVASGTAELRCYDCALGKLSTALLCEIDYVAPENALKLSKFLPGDNGLVSLTWPSYGGSGSSDQHNEKDDACHDRLLILFDGGPFAMLKLHLGVMTGRMLRPIEMIREHVAHENIDSAVKILLTINWNIEASSAFLAMITIVNHLLKHPLAFESEEQLETSLSAFYAPKNPITEAVVVEYRHTMSRYARRFFHHLLRFRRFEKAFLLAKDIHDLDLFVDLYFYAKECGDTTVAKAAKQKMIELYSSSDEDSESENTDRRKEKKPHSGRRKESSARHSVNIIRPKNKLFRVSSPRIRKEIVPPSYPPLKRDDFMKSLISETRAVLEGKAIEQEEALPRNGDISTSTLKILDYGYV